MSENPDRVVGVEIRAHRGHDPADDRQLCAGAEHTASGTTVSVTLRYTQYTKAQAS